MEIMPPLEVPLSAETEDFPVRISRKRKKSEEDVSQKE
jgi:hypothetical protein